jgi:hypothetical protein
MGSLVLLFFSLFPFPFFAMLGLSPPFIHLHCVRGPSLPSPTSTPWTCLPPPPTTLCARYSCDRAVRAAPPGEAVDGSYPEADTFPSVRVRSCSLCVRSSVARSHRDCRAPIRENRVLAVSSAILLLLSTPLRVVTGFLFVSGFFPFCSCRASVANWSFAFAAGELALPLSRYCVHLPGLSDAMII